VFKPRKNAKDPIGIIEYPVEYPDYEADRDEMKDISEGAEDSDDTSDDSTDLIIEGEHIVGNTTSFE
jgi:hypothetical protein